MNPVTILRAYCWMRFSRWAARRYHESMFAPGQLPCATYALQEMEWDRQEAVLRLLRERAADYAQAYQHARAGIR